MPPKKRATTRKTADLSQAKTFRLIPSISRIYDEVATSQDNAAGAVFAETLERIVQKASSGLLNYTDDQVRSLFEGGKVEGSCADLVTRQRVSLFPAEASASSRSVRASGRAKRSVKKEVEEETEVVTETLTEERTETVVTTGDVFDEADMETDDNDVTPEAPEPRMATPPIDAKMTDAEFEDVAVPRTLLRMQQMSISRHVDILSSASRSTVCHGTPRRNNTRDVLTNPATPRHVFPTTPGRTAPTASSRTPHRGAPSVSESNEKGDDKHKHAENLRTKVIEQKKETARKNDEKRARVLERKRELERQQLEKIEEQKRKEERAANFLRQQKEYKSPTRARIAAAEPRTPSSKYAAARKVFQTDVGGASTPGRGAAKRGRIEVPAGKGQKTTIAEATVNLSPSRHLPRSTSRHVKHEPMDISGPSSPPPPSRIAKPKAKAKRSQNPTSSSSTASVSAAAAAKAEAAARAEAAMKAEAARLQAEQERYLLQQAEEEKARAVAEEKRRREKKAAQEKAEAAKRHQAEEMAKLKAIQEEEAKKLREQSEKEEKELQETLKLQAEKKARQEKLGKTPPPAAYEMTPPRTYKAQSKNDYGLHDLNSDDETDQEDDPRKEVPGWADFAVVRDRVRQQISNPPFDVTTFFGEIEKPDLKAIFGDSIKVKKRGSSAVWKSPAASNAHSARRVLEEIME